jgi:hypothetical protein
MVRKEISKTKTVRLIVYYGYELGNWVRVSMNACEFEAFVNTNYADLLKGKLRPLSECWTGVVFRHCGFKPKDGQEIAVDLNDETAFAALLMICWSCFHTYAADRTTLIKKLYNDCYALGRHYDAMRNLYAPIPYAHIEKEAV